LELAAISVRGKGNCVVKIMRTKSGNHWDIRHGKRDFLFLTACKQKLEMRAILNRKKGVYIVKSMYIETGNDCDII
jgi:hypothetical protein